MSITHFFQQLQHRLNTIVMRHPIEIVMVIAYAVPLLIMDTSVRGGEHFGYWMFEPMLFAFIYLTRPYRFYYFSWIVPILVCLVVWQTNDFAAFYFYSAQFWGATGIMLIALCSFPFVKNNQTFVYHHFKVLLHLILAFIVGGIIMGLSAILLSWSNVLLGIGWDLSVYTKMSLFWAYLCIPLFFLLFEQSQSREEITVSPIFEILNNFILGPALIIFTILLYVYVGVILSNRHLPDGAVAGIVLPYLLLGLVVYLLRMLPQSRPRWHRFFNIYPYLAIIPLGLLWMAVEVRIATYALTVSRIYLVAMSIALSLAYLVLIIPKIRQYRLISVIAMLFICSITWLSNPAQIAYQSQTERFIALLDKLNLRDEQGKLKSVYEIRSRLENISSVALNDWQNLKSTKDYLVNEMPKPADRVYWDKYDKESAFIAQYGPSAYYLLTMYIEDNQVLLFEESEVSNYEFRQGYDKPLNIKDYRNLYLNGHYSYRVKNKPNEAFFCWDKENYCLDLDTYIHTQMKRHGLDPMQIQKKEDLDKLKENLLVIDQPQFKIYLSRLNITFVPGQGYIFQSMEAEVLLEK